MSKSNTSAEALLKQMDILLEEDDISTKNGLRFAFTVLREAMVTLGEMEERVRTSENAYLTVVQSSTRTANEMDDVAKKVNAMWTGYKLMTWVATVFGVSIITLIWSLITGAVSINYGGVP